ncbi:hypothetical protein ACS0TY_000502 [Phlomoides rotata]
MNSLMKLKFVGCPKSFSRLRMFSSEIKRLDGGVSMVQGASRGIGLEIVKQLLEKTKEGHVVATCCNPSVATGLLELKNKFADRLDIHRLHLTNYTTIEETAKAVEDKYGCLNLLINASALISIPHGGHTGKTLSGILRSYEVNAIGPLMVLKGMLPLLKAGGTDSEIAVVANIIHGNTPTTAINRRRWHSFLNSQDSLHQLTRCVLKEQQQSKEDGIKCILLSPGVRQTKQYSVRKLLHTINEVKTSKIRPVYSDNELDSYYYAYM